MPLFFYGSMPPLTPQVLQKVVGLQSAREVWWRLEKLHLIQSRSRVLQLKQQFQNLKKGGLSITNYLNKMKGIDDALEAICYFAHMLTIVITSNNNAALPKLLMDLGRCHKRFGPSTLFPWN